MSNPAQKRTSKSIVRVLLLVSSFVLGGLIMYLYLSEQQRMEREYFSEMRVLTYYEHLAQLNILAATVIHDDIEDSYVFFCNHFRKAKRISGEYYPTNASTVPVLEQVQEKLEWMRSNGKCE